MEGIMLESLQQFSKEIGRELARTWEHLSDGWSELLTRSSNALTRYTHKDAAQAGDGTAGDAPNWGLLAGDVSDDGRNIVVRLELPGVDRDDYDIVVDGSTLYIRGEKRYDAEHIGSTYYMRQCAYGSFQRVISLPHNVDAARAEAIYRSGVLTVKLPKAAATQPHRVAVR
jgi:HSP20 family protein